MNFKETEIGKIPQDWSIEIIESLLEDIIDYRGKTPKKSDKGIKTLSAKSVKDGYIDYDSAYTISDETYKEFMVRGIPKKGDILITTEAPLGLVAKLDRNNIAIAQRLLALRSDKYKLFNDYLMYYLKSKIGQHELNVRASGTTVLGIKQSEFRKIRVVLPPLEEQKAIAKILSDLDDKIEVNNKINKNLEEMAQAIFKHWFIDFEFPNEEGKPYKSSGGEMVESELGMIPKGWEVSSLSHIATYLNGLAMQKFRPKNEKESFKVMKIKELRQGFTDNNSDLCSSNIESKYVVKDGDVIFSWSGTLLVDIWCGGECGLNQHLFKVTSETYNKWFYYMWTKYHLDNFIKIAESKATTMGHIKRSDLSSARVLIPNDICLQKMDSLFNSIIEKIIKVNIETKRLNILRDTLLPKLMSGEIRVSINKNIED